MVINKTLITKVITHLREWKGLYFATLFFALVIYFFIEVTKKPTPISPTHKPVTTIVKNGKTYSQYEVDELTKAQMKKFVDSLEAYYKGKVKTITTTVVRIDTVFIRVPVETLDTGLYTIEHEDAYLQLHADINANTGFGQFSLKLQDTLTTAIVARNPLIGRSTINAIVTNKSPYIKPVSGTGATLKERRVIISVGPTVIYDPFLNDMRLGVGATIPVFSIKTRK